MTAVRASIPSGSGTRMRCFVGEDRVALDTIAWEMIERKRTEVGLPTLEAAGRPPRYIATAADAAHSLGTNDPQRINRVEI